jgi:hypothetical protein
MATTFAFNPFTGNLDLTLLATANVQAWMATPSSANLAAAVTDETGSGALVFATSPTFTTTGTLSRASVGATSADGWVLTNPTAAAAGAQQFSPRLRFTGQGWKTTATAASQTVDWVVENRPVQGAASPATNLVFSSQINGGGYTPRLSALSSGELIFPGSDSATNNLIGLSITGSTQGSDRMIRGYFGWVFAPGGTNKHWCSLTGFAVASDQYIAWDSSTVVTGNTPDLFLLRAAAATLQVGQNVNGAAVSQTLQACNGITGTDRTGGNFTFASGKGTGAGAESEVRIGTPTAVGSGTTAQAITTRVTINSSGLKATGYLSSDGSAGVTAGPYTTITSITVKNGLITALTGA